MASNGRHTDGKLRFGIIGCGSIGPTHAGALQQIDGVELIAVADTVKQRAQEMACKFDVGRIYASDRELIADPELDVVCVCTPSGMHADMAVAAMNAGKHVITEKPMDVSLSACDRMIAAERQTGRKLSVISQHRFDPASKLVKETIESGKLGRIVLADASVKWWRTQGYYDSGDWRGTWALDGGGALMNQGVHTVDVLQWLVGNVASLYALTRTAAHERIEVEDIAVAALTFASGAVGTFTATTAAYNGLPARIDIFGTDGSAIIEGDCLKSMNFKDGQQTQGTSASAHAVSVAQGGTASVRDDAAQRQTVAAVGTVWGDAHRAQFDDFVRAIRTDGKPLIDGHEGRLPVQTIMAVYESARTGRPVNTSGGATARPPKRRGSRAQVEIHV